MNYETLHRIVDMEGDEFRNDGWNVEVIPVLIQNVELTADREALIITLMYVHWAGDEELANGPLHNLVHHFNVKTRELTDA